MADQNPQNPWQDENGNLLSGCKYCGKRYPKAGSGNNDEHYKNCKSLSPKTIGELPHGLLLVTDRQEANEVRRHVGRLAEGYDSFFVAIGEGEYIEVWGFEGIVPWNNKKAWRLL